MKTQFSEFSYGFALAFELMNAIQPFATGAPVFPSLQEEATLGFDVNFTPAGWPLFLQFKIADYLSRRGKFAGEHNNCPYFRISLYKRNESFQHQNLKQLAKIEPEVYYATPAFVREQDFNRFFSTSEIFTNTVFIRVEDVPDLPDDDQHYITYSRSTLTSSSQFIFHSNHSQPFGHPLYGKEWLEHLRGVTKQKPKLSWDYLYSLRDELFTIIKGSFQPGLFDLPTFTGDEHLNVMQDLRRLLSTHFGAILIFLQPPRNN